MIGPCIHRLSAVSGETLGRLITFTLISLNFLDISQSINKPGLCQGLEDLPRVGYNADFQGI
jgi:hypothetical protein